MIRVILPYHLRALAQTDGEVKLAVEGEATQRSVLDALEARYPMLRGTIRDHVTQLRRASCASTLAKKTFPTNRRTLPLPEKVKSGAEPFWIVGAIAGG